MPELFTAVDVRSFEPARTEQLVHIIKVELNIHSTAHRIDRLGGCAPESYLLRAPVVTVSNDRMNLCR